MGFKYEPRTRKFNARKFDIFHCTKFSKTIRLWFTHHIQMEINCFRAPCWNSLVGMTRDGRSFLCLCHSNSSMKVNQKNTLYVHITLLSNSPACFMEIWSSFPREPCAKMRHRTLLEFWKQTHFLIGKSQVRGASLSRFAPGV